ncbi:fungal-specific transcription factor domain-containing protein [Jackrogersella minutella]|nr:fungal-specific transcription factor domain-containing protein [Jackrogersella minutella]
MSPDMFADASTNSSPAAKSGGLVPNSVASEGPRPLRPRPKRSQVTRACDWCRVHRIKCDDNHPCLNCQARGGECSNDRTTEVRTLPHAFREIERLRQRNQELQKELEEERIRNRSQDLASAGSSNLQIPTPPSVSSGSLPTIVALMPPVNNGLSCHYWDGVYTSTARSPAKTWYGPSSLLYFVSRVNSCLSSKLKAQFPEHYMQPNSASRLLDGPTSPSENSTGERSRVSLDDDHLTKEFLTPTQEEYFLNLYWQSYHTSLVVLYEDDFRQHYKSLWVGSGKKRKPSALVDIVIALCLQYGMAQGRAKSNASIRSVDVDINDATLAGRRHYCRCQTLLASEMESPTLSTLQCNILSVIWLCCASFQNMADSTLALTSRTAQMLGLHLPPPQDMPQREKELRKRLWWSIYVLETKTSMKLGRPFMLHLSHVGAGLPSDDLQAAEQSGSDFAPLDDNTTWLSWDLHNTKLVLAVRNVYTAFYDTYMDIFNSDSIAVPTIEMYADSLSTHMGALEQWKQDVPTALKIGRRNHGTPFSTDRSPLDIEKFAPLWVQRQRLLLELSYHNLCANLYRPFLWLRSVALLSLPPILAWTSESTPLTDSCNHRCASHAMASTHIMRQILSTTDLLTGWHEAFQWQWNCAMTLVGFVLSYPHDELTPAVRDAINASIDVLGIFGNSFAVAASAAEVVRSLSVTVDQIVASEYYMGKRSQQDDRDMAREDQYIPIMPQGEPVPAAGGQTDLGYPEFDEDTLVAMEEIMAGSMDMAFTIDGYNSGNILWPNGGPTG